MTGMDKKSKKPLRIKIISMGNAEVGKVRISLFCYLKHCYINAFVCVQLFFPLALMVMAGAHVSLKSIYHPQCLLLQYREYNLSVIFYLHKCIFLFRVILCKYTLSEDILDSYFAYSIFIHASGFKQCSFKTSKISRFLLWNMPTSCFNTLLKIKESTRILLCKRQD